jgi:WD40 repeat protein
VAVAYNGRRDRLAAGGYDKIARIFDAKTGALLYELKGHTKRIRENCVIKSPDGRYVFTGGNDWTARRWDLNTGREIECFKFSEAVIALDISPDGKYLAAGIDDGSVEIREIKSEIRNMKSDGKIFSYKSKREVYTVVFSPDGRLLAIGELDSTARVFEISSKKEVRAFRGHGGGVRAVAFSSDGKYLVTGCDDYNIRFWDLGAGKMLRRLEGHAAQIARLRFSPDGRRLAAKDWAGEIKLWDTETGREALTLKEPGLDFMDVDFSPAGRSIATGSSQGQVVIFNAFPWKESEYGSGSGLGSRGRLEDRVEMYKRQYWKERMAPLDTSKGLLGAKAQEQK